ncbi:MAG: 4-hydroxy-3-methylbut-2-enyl diphosphate reductase [Deltaproteobacteria bacterium GWC2_42_11]|nr:MAG: 4-hydroxy-3-methylbut-2-enyl diphosphate reductase [Deltaproteobacteria bacterium GWC2_42_11]HBO83762.1 4-hydroxy-3-methylbut-2-enyl diphosphate reductase [Deltaproteobacteria bacterium]
MEIFIVKTAGFCFGVKRAINMAYDAAGTASGGDIYTIGPIIHNPQVVSKLEESNIHTAENISNIKNGTVIVRSHGITSREMRGIREKDLNMVDATCPFVKKAQEYVERLSKDGYFIVVVGEKEHPEVKGIVSYANKNICIAGSVDDIKSLPRVKKMGVVAQTTQSIENLQAIVSACLKKTNELKVFNTICNATSVRQNESTDLAAKVECMIVVGGRNSANTNRLAEVCRKIQPNTHHIEIAAELKPEWFKEVGKVGITAGASTPDWIIEDVVAKVRNMNLYAEAGESVKE